MIACAIEADSIVRLVMNDFPETVGVFLRRRMHCPGCAMAGFSTLAEAASSYAIEPADLLAELRRAVAAPAAGRRT